MDREPTDFSALFPNIAAQLRGALGNLHLAAARLAPAAERERDPALDARAALLDQSYYQLLRLVNNLTAAGLLDREEPYPMLDRDLAETARDVCGKVRDLAEMLGIRLEFRSARDQQICAFCRPAIEQLLYQLLSNAFKFTPAGGTVTVEVKTAGHQVLLSVSDTGCGIEEDQIPYLFDRYLHEEAKASLHHGLGLGLSICQHIAERHGGAMMAESKPGQGSRFTLSLPNRRCGQVDVSDVPFDYNGGFNPVLLALADALPPEAFSQRHLD